MRALVGGFAGYGIMRCPIFVDDPSQMSADGRTASQQVLDQIAQTQPGTLILHRNWVSNAAEIANLDRVLAKLHTLAPHTRILVLGGVPKWLVGLPELILDTATLIHEGSVLAIDLHAIRAADHALQAAAQKGGAAFVSALDLMCSGETCFAIAALPDGRLEPTAFDYGHLTEAGSRHLTTVLAPVMGFALH